MIRWFLGSHAASFLEQFWYHAHENAKVGEAVYSIWAKKETGSWIPLTGAYSTTALPRD